MVTGDPGADTIQSVTVDWGDGTVQVFPGAPGFLTHVYAIVDRTYTINVSVTDEEGTFTFPGGVAVDAELPSTVAATVAEVYQDLLGRDVDPSGLASWSAQLAAGVPIAMGTDAGNPGTAHGPSVYREMEAMQRAGLPAADVLASATIVAARAMGIADDAGSLEAGKRADLVVLDADPTTDIANARRVRLVMRNGAPYTRPELVARP